MFTSDDAYDVFVAMRVKEIMLDARKNPEKYDISEEIVRWIDNVISNVD